MRFESPFCAIATLRSDEAVKIIARSDVILQVPLVFLILRAGFLASENRVKDLKVHVES